MFQDVFNNTNGYIHIESKDLISTQFECNLKDETPRHIGQRIGPKINPPNPHPVNEFCDRAPYVKFIYNDNYNYNTVILSMQRKTQTNIKVIS